MSNNLINGKYIILAGGTEADLCLIKKVIKKQFNNNMNFDNAPRTS